MTGSTPAAAPEGEPTVVSPPTGEGSPLAGTRAGRLAWRRWLAHPDVATFGLGLAVAVGVCWPVLGTRPLFLLDWVIGPHPPLPPPSAYGLDGGLTAGLAGSMATSVLVRLVGEAATWLLLFATFPIAAVGVGRLTGGWRWARLCAAAFYCVNPWVLNRVYAGQLTLLLGYALLPYAVTSALRATEPGSTPGPRMLAPALWWAALTAIAPHYAWIYGVVLLAVVVVTRPRSWQLARWLVLWPALFAATSMYVLLPHTATELPTRVGTGSLEVFRTTSDPNFGLFANVASLYGFWRLGPGPTLAKDAVTGWPLVMLAILVVVAIGLRDALRHRARVPAGTAPPGTTLPDTTPPDATPPDTTLPDTTPPDTTLPDTTPPGATPPDATLPDTTPPGATRPGTTLPDTTPPGATRRRRAQVLAVAGVAGYFLSLGAQGPTGGLFRWAYDHVPFFAVMREPQKFLLLLALAYAVGLGWGVERLRRGLPPGRSRPTSNRARPTPRTGRRPRPARALRPALAAAVGLALPLAYTPTLFDGIAGQIGPSTVPASYQRADALMGDGPGQVLYLPWHLYEALPFTGGRVVATLGPSAFGRTVIAGDNLQVGAVQTESTSLRSAFLQRLVAAGPAISGFGQDVAPLGVEYVVLAKAVDWRSYRWLDHQPDLRPVLDSRSLEVWRDLAYRGPGLRSGSRAPVRQLSPVAYRVPPGRAGTVEIDAAYQPGWELDGRAGLPTASGTVEFAVGAAGGIARFRPWGLAELGDVISGACLLALAGALAWDRLRRTERHRRRSPRGRGDPGRALRM